jgi:hypothetical protein
VLVQQFAKPPECDQRRFDCFRRYSIRCEDVVSEADGFPGQMNDLIGPSGHHPGNRQPDGVTPDVNGGNSGWHRSQSNSGGFYARQNNGAAGESSFSVWRGKIFEIATKLRNLRKQWRDYRAWIMGLLP